MYHFKTKKVSIFYGFCALFFYPVVKSQCSRRVYALRGRKSTLLLKENGAIKKLEYDVGCKIVFRFVYEVVVKLFDSLSTFKTLFSNL